MNPNTPTWTVHLLSQAEPSQEHGAMTAPEGQSPEHQETPPAHSAQAHTEAPASADAHHGVAEEQTFMDYILHSNVINIALVLLFLAWAFKKFNLMGGLETAHQKTVKDISDLEAKKKEAQAQLNAVKKQTENLTQEVNQILQNARSSAEGLSKQILSDAEGEAAKIIEASKKRIEQEERAAIQNLETRLLADAIQDAREELAKNLDDASRKRSVEAFIDELPNLKK